jgi:excinuclease UvrABC ATPase subunit
MLNRYQPMHANSWARWINQTLISSKVCHLLFLSIRNLPIEIHDPRLEQLLKFMIIFAFCLLALENLIALKCGKAVTRQSPQAIVDQILELPPTTKFQVLAPVVRARKGEFLELFSDLITQGYSRARIDGEVVQLSEAPKLKKQEKHTIEVVIDRLTAKAESKTRLTDSIETALRLASGIVVLDFVDAKGADQRKNIQRASGMS